MRLDYSSKLEVLQFVNEQIGEAFSPVRDAAVGIRSNDGQLVAGWVWHNYFPEAGTIEFSGAAISPRWI
ncbi:MAG: N-acetyltransferase, partial [Pseudomonadota bacterium]